VGKELIGVSTRNRQNGNLT